MQKRVCSFAAAAFIVCVAGAARAETSVFFLESSTSGCAGKVRALPGAEQRVMFTAKACPTQVLWDVEAKEMWSVEDKHLVWRKMGDAKVNDAGALPQAEIARLWVDKGGGVRASYLVNVDEKDVVVSGKKTTIQFEGKSYDAPVDDGARFPPWGAPAMAVLVEYKDGAWKRLEASPTKTEAGDTPGVNALSSPVTPKKGLVSLADLIALSTANGAPSTVMDCSDNKRLTKLFPAEEAGRCTLSLGKAAVAVSTRMGDTPHFVGPLYVCAGRECANPKTVPGPFSDQLSIAVSGGFFIVADEYSNAGARIFDTNGKLVAALPKQASAAVFLPAALAP